MRRRRVSILALALPLVAGLSACGARGGKSTVGDSEGFYTRAGQITYQVELSRQLNPYSAEDKTYLTGLPAGTSLAIPARGVSGPGTIFDTKVPKLTLVGITDGTSNTVMLIEAGDPIPWAKPGDFVFDPNKPLPKLESPGWKCPRASLLFLERNCRRRVSLLAQLLEPHWIQILVFLLIVRACE